MSLLATILGTGADVMASGGIGSVFGGILGIGQKYFTAKLEQRERQFEREHELALLNLHHDQELQMAKQELLQTEITASSDMLRSGYEHDTSFKSSTSVNNIRALVRPSLTTYALIAAGFNPEVYAGFAGLMVSWWFSARIKVEKFL
jgi:hypothetical protein